jgi:hypothetical protein
MKITRASDRPGRWPFFVLRLSRISKGYPSDSDRIASHRMSVVVRRQDRAVRFDFHQAGNGDWLQSTPMPRQAAGGYGYRAAILTPSMAIFVRFLACSPTVERRRCLIVLGQEQRPRSGGRARERRRRRDRVRPALWDTIAFTPNLPSEHSQSALVAIPRRLPIASICASRLDRTIASCSCPIFGQPIVRSEMLRPDWNANRLEISSNA